MRHSDPRTSVRYYIPQANLDRLAAHACAALPHLAAHSSAGCHFARHWALNACAATAQNDRVTLEAELRIRCRLLQIRQSWRSDGIFAPQ
jgi:hypothetical protein